MCRRVTKEESDHRAEAMDINGAEILDGFVLGHFAAQYAQQLGKGFLATCSMVLSPVMIRPRSGPYHFMRW